MNIDLKKPLYTTKGITVEDTSIIELANGLSLDKHPNGGYFKETDRSKTTQSTVRIDNVTVERNPSSLIHFLMTCESTIGKFHTNITSRSIHILQRGSGVYILIHPNGKIEKFKVGFNVANGERTQWVVEPGVYKGCYLIPTNDNEESNKDCLLISEVVVPGFDFQDMKFLDIHKLIELVGEKTAEDLTWLI